MIFWKNYMAKVKLFLNLKLLERWNCRSNLKIFHWSGRPQEMTKATNVKNVCYSLWHISYDRIGILVPNDGNTDSQKYFVNIDENLWQVLSKP